MSSRYERGSTHHFEALRKEYQQLGVFFNLKTLENRPFVPELMNQIETGSQLRCIVVMGLPGSGKTTTALQASRFMSDYYAGELLVKQFNFDFYRKFLMIRHGSTEGWSRKHEWLELNRVMLKDIERYIEISNYYYAEIAKLTYGGQGVIGIPLIEMPGIGEVADQGETVIRELQSKAPGQVMVIVVVGQEGLIDQSVNVRNFVQSDVEDLQRQLYERFQINVAPRPGDVVSDSAIKEVFGSMAPERFLRSIPEELDRLAGNVPLQDIVPFVVDKDTRALHGLTRVEKGRQVTRIAYYKWLLNTWGIPPEHTHIVVNKFHSKHIYYPIHTSD